ncbi:MAG TPA: type II CAAX endopeptidase family protein [Acidobacteriaceae bacterium]|jgi:hypothetical protein|nr:type II CAAX endopeptidase family protein [Acidobacteriaceae bacterium]
MDSPEDIPKKNAPPPRSPIFGAQYDLPPAQRKSIFVGEDGLRPFWRLLIYLAILSPGVLYIILESSGPQHPHPFSLLESATKEWLAFGFIFFATWIMSRIEDRSVFHYGLARTPRRISWLITGALWGLLFMSILVAILSLTHHLVFTGVLLRPFHAFGYGLAWAVAFLGVGFFEEFLFRGYLQFNLTQCFAGLFRWIAPRSRHAGAAGFWTAAVLISFGFGLVHKANAGESPIGLLCAGLASLLFALTLWRTGSLWWAIGLHAAWDWAQSFLYGVADSGAISRGHLLGSHPAGSTLLSGGLTGPEGSLFVLPVMFLIVLVIVFTLPRSPSVAADLPWSETEPVPAPSGTLA